MTESHCLALLAFLVMYVYFKDVHLRFEFYCDLLRFIQVRAGDACRSGYPLAAVMEALAQPTQPLLSTITSLAVGEAKRKGQVFYRSFFYGRAVNDSTDVFSAKMACSVKSIHDLYLVYWYTINPA